jgi:DNA-directed RNA polymerase specialized sigma24 family protein
VQCVLAGDLNALEGIVRRWQHRLVNLAWRFCRDRTMVEEMAQEVFIKVSGQWAHSATNQHFPRG